MTIAPRAIGVGPATAAHTSIPAACSVIGRGNAIMGGPAKLFTHEELRELADYIGRLPGVLKTVPESRFRR